MSSVLRAGTCRDFLCNAFIYLQSLIFSLQLVKTLGLSMTFSTAELQLNFLSLLSSV